MFDHPFDNLGVAFPEGRHEARDLPVVLRVNVGPGRVQQLDNLEVASIGGQPQAGIAFLVPHIDLEKCQGSFRSGQIKKNNSDPIL